MVFVIKSSEQYAPSTFSTFQYFGFLFYLSDVGMSLNIVLLFANFKRFSCGIKIEVL